jgi:hypothetical protein
MSYLFLQNGGAMMNHSKPLLDDPIPATVPVTSATAATAPAVSSSAPAVAVALPQPLLPTSQGQETKQERRQRSVFLFVRAKILSWSCCLLCLQKKIFHSGQYLCDLRLHNGYIFVNCNFYLNLNAV